jgi:hypothetical protein
MKKPYLKPQLEHYSYLPEEGYANSVALHTDYALIEGHDGSTLRTSEEVTEVTDDGGEWMAGEWTI